MGPDNGLVRSPFLGGQIVDGGKSVQEHPRDNAPAGLAQGAFHAVALHSEGLGQIVLQQQEIVPIIELQFLGGVVRKGAAADVIDDGLRHDGYRVTFDLVTGEHIDKMLLKPGDELSYREYLENYLYDDIHQVRGKWYNHLLPDDKIDQMILSSCKFTAGEKIDQVKDRITVTAFVYRGDDDFDEDGNYIGPLSYTVTMINKK